MVKLGAGTFVGGFTISSDVAIEGAGANETTISNPAPLSVPEVTAAAGVSASIEDLTVSGAVGGAAINTGIVTGSGSLLLDDITVADIGFNGVSAAPVSVLPSAGNATVTVLNSTISDGAGEYSGGIDVNTPTGTAPSSLSVVNSTISGGEGGAESGGAILLANSDASLRDDTVADNDGNFSGGLYVGPGSTATVTDTVLATNHAAAGGPSASDCVRVSSGTVTSGGHNLVGVASPGASGDCGFTNGVNGDVTGSATSPLNPDLGPLAANGGPTETQALLAGSPAVGTGNPIDCQAAPVNDLDQRGDSRAANTRHACDIGAYDTGKHDKSVSTTLKVSKSKRAETSCVASSSHPFPTIAAALACAQNGDMVKLGAGTFVGGFTISSDVAIEGAGANETTISNPAPLSVPEVTAAAGVSASIEDLTVSGAVGGAAINTGIVTGSGSLLLDDITVADIGFNGVSAAPVSVLPSAGNATVTVLNSTISDGAGEYSGGIDVNTPTGTAPSSLSVVNSTISGGEGGAESGGAILLANSDASLRDDTVADNDGNFSGGLYVGPGSTATVTDTVLATNHAAAGGPSASDCVRVSSGTVTSGGHNLVGVASPGASGDCGFTNGVNGDVTGSATSPLNPDLGPLAANGGPTETQALLAGSPAVGTGNPIDCQAAPVNDLDQRGDSRAANTRHACDIGAYDTGRAA